MNGRIDRHPILGPLPPRKQIRFQFDDRTYLGYEGETIAAALLANGVPSAAMKRAGLPGESIAISGIVSNAG